MNMNLDSTTLDFREELRQRAAKKRKASFEALKLRKEMARAAKRGKPAEPVESMHALSALISQQLKEIRALLRQNDVGAVKFVVTERDEHGKIKAFEVKR